MKMTTTDKIIIGAAAVTMMSAATFVYIDKKYKRKTSEVSEELQSIEYLLSKCREDIILGNKEISQGNKLLREIIKKSLEDQK